MNPNISVVMIVKNEGLQLVHSLPPLRQFSEVLLVDSGSTDDTVSVARGFGCRVLMRDWTGFGDQKRFAVASASNDWILSLDADEVVDQDFISEVLGLDLADDHLGFELRRRNFFLGKEIKHSGWNPDWVLRLFNRRVSTFSSDFVHERVVHTGPVRRLRSPILHFSYRTEDDVRRKILQYSVLRRPAGVFSRRFPLVNACFTFFRTFVLRLGFLDGVAGFRVAIMNARVNLNKYRGHLYR